MALPPLPGNSHSQTQIPMSHHEPIKCTRHCLQTTGSHGSTELFLGWQAWWTDSTLLSQAQCFNGLEGKKVYEAAVCFRTLKSLDLNV